MMDSDNNSKDLEQDEELVALRLAALATLKSRAISQPKKDTTLNSSTLIDNVPVIPVRSTVPYVVQGKNDQIGSAAQGNQHYWRNPTPLRWGRGRGTFPKINQRSNLIVITPVNTNDNGTEEKTSVSSLVLPQHRWCQSANEDSSSPKTYTKRGPTRFNRHDSETDSSDSDYDNSDNGSYSNETILQDEHSETLDQMTPDETSLGEPEQQPQKCSDRRLSFKDVDPDLPPINSAKDTKPFDNEDGRQRNDSDKTWKHDSKIYSSYNSQTRSPTCETYYPSVDTLKDHSISSNGKALEFSSHYKTADSIQRKNSYDDELLDLNKRDSNLPENDLRLELKKRLQKLNPDIVEADKKQKNSYDREQTASPTGRFRKKSGSHDNLKRDAHASEKIKIISPYKNHRFSSSSSPDSRPRRNWSSERKSRESSTNRERNDLKGSTSIDRSNKKSTSHSPDRNKRRTPSRSPSYSDKHSVKRNRSNTRMSSSSPGRYDRHKMSKSPNKCHQKRRLSKSPDQHNRHKTSRSPNKRHKHQERSHSPIEFHRKSLPRSRNKGNSYSPEKSHKQAHGKNSDKNHKKQSLHSQPRGNYSRSSDKLHNKARGRSKHKRSWSSVSSSSRSPERKRSRHHKKFNRSSSSVSSSSSRASSSGSSYSPSRVRMSSVVKPVLSVESMKNLDNSCKDKSSDAQILSKRGKDVDDKPKPPASTVKSSIVGGENLSSASDSGKRLPVHMRLGTLPRNRVIQMTKDVEAAFVNTSSEDEMSSANCKKQNFRVVTEMASDQSSEVTKRLVEKSFSGGNDASDERVRRKKIYR